MSYLIYHIVILFFYFGPTAAKTSVDGELISKILTIYKVEASAYLDEFAKSDLKEIESDDSKALIRSRQKF